MALCLSLFKKTRVVVFNSHKPLCLYLSLEPREFCFLVIENYRILDLSIDFSQRFKILNQQPCALQPKALGLPSQAMDLMIYISSKTLSSFSRLQLLNLTISKMLVSHLEELIFTNVKATIVCIIQKRMSKDMSFANEIQPRFEISIG